MWISSGNRMVAVPAETPSRPVTRLTRWAKLPARADRLSQPPIFSRRLTSTAPLPGTVNRVWPLSSFSET